VKIPVFVSCPTALNKAQEAQRSMIFAELEALNLEPRSLGTSDYPSDLPLREVLTIAKHCSGAVILGFNQFTSTAGVRKPGTKMEQTTSSPLMFPSEWNNLEAGILFALRKPLLVFRETGISGGVFDFGVTDVFVHNMPQSKGGPHNLKEVFLKWRDKVGATYYAG
jgi:hypothetical protein